MNSIKKMYMDLGISENVYEYCNEKWNACKDNFAQIDSVSEYNQLKVLTAMQNNKISDAHLLGSTGYGYTDIGRDALERVYADIFHTEDALVRSQITCGTHALTVALFGNLRPGDELIYVTGKPYDTMEGIIGIDESKECPGSLREYGIKYKQADLLPDGSFDYDTIKALINKKTKIIAIQRSKGYSVRPTLSVSIIKECITFIKNINPDIICMVDNCYGEFVETLEPSDVGADMCVGSLIKNPGGGLAPMGGYIAGTKKCIENASFRLTTPALGKEVGASLNINQSLYQGLFMAPQVTASALKGAIFAANIYEGLGYKCIPDSKESRHDIIQSVAFKNADAVIAFCEGIQAAAPIDSHVKPEPYAMPGYHSDVIMAAGAFVSGSSIELSADAPIEPPYAVYFQGGLTWQHAKFGIMMSLQKMYDKGIAFPKNCIYK
ncbi:MAG: hypothetical protein E7265_01525 [Lachnospiraceae bacterium]|nr:hypothetical protein [Lachnospiraceae bacterium]